MKTTLVLLAALMLFACGTDNSVPQDAARTGAEQAADTLYINGVIWTGAKGAPDAAVMAVKDGVVTYVGDGETVRITARETVDRRVGADGMNGRQRLARRNMNQ